MAKIKVYDYVVTSIPLANPVSTYESPWSDNGDPNVLKRFRKLIIEVDNQSSGTITVIPEVDGVALTSFNITATGRKETIYSFPVDTTGYLWRIRASSTTTMRVYQAKVEALADPSHVTKYESAWGNEGTVNRKRFRDVIVDLLTNGQDVTVTPWIDGVSLTPFTVNNSARSVKILSLPIDTTGTVCRLTTSGSSAHTVYAHRFTYTEEPAFGSVRESQWTDDGWPYDKLWKHCVVDIDTASQAATLKLWIDNVEHSSYTVTTTGRQLKTISFGQNVIGKLARITVSGTDAQLFDVKYAADKEPPDVTTADSYEQSFGYEGWKILKRLYLAVKAPATLTVKVYADEVLKDTLTTTSNLSSGYANVKLDLGPGIKGKLFRFVFTSNSAFKLYFDKSFIEMKRMNQDDGWAHYNFTPPQTF